VLPYGLAVKKNFSDQEENNIFGLLIASLSFLFNRLMFLLLIK